MNEIIVDFNSKKRIKILFWGIGLTLVSIVFILLMLNYGTKIRIYPLGVMIVCAGFGIFMILGGLKNLLSKDKAGLIVNPKGVVFKGTPLARKAGLIAWADVEKLAIGTAYDSQFIFLKLYNPEKYTRSVTPQLRQKVANEGIGVTSDELSIDFNGLKNLIEQYYNQYK